MGRDKRMQGMSVCVRRFTDSLEMLIVKKGETYQTFLWTHVAWSQDAVRQDERPPVMTGV
eukprot:751197-Hanusia_phi.AAC.4